MKHLSVFLLAIILFSSAVPFAYASPFSDVLSNHWAYNALNQLSVEGIVKGFPNGFFNGNKKMSRYEFAVVISGAMAHVEQTFENKPMSASLDTLEKLTIEFSNELSLLGVKSLSIEDDVAVIREDMSSIKTDIKSIKDYSATYDSEKVKISGNMLVRHTNLITKNDNDPDNTTTDSQLRFTFKANIDENITAVARWRIIAKDNDTVSKSASGFGAGGIGAPMFADNVLDIAYLHVKDMFQFGGDFTFGRQSSKHGHNLILSDEVDAARYKRRSGDIDIVLQAIYDRHKASYRDNGKEVDFRGLWNLNFDTNYCGHDLYLGFYNQNNPNRYNRMLTKAGLGVAWPLGNKTVGQQKSDYRFDVEFGSKGSIDSKEHWSYDFGLVFTNYEVDRVNNLAGQYLSPELQGWTGHMAAEWDSKKEWAAKLAFAFADDEAMGGMILDNDTRYSSGSETPYEDISRGNSYFKNGLKNMTDIKIQAEYRPENHKKHYLRFACDFLDEVEDITSNELVKADKGYDVTGDPPEKSNTLYDRWNNFGTSDAQALVFSFEYCYQLAKATKLRVGYTDFNMDGDAQKSVKGVASIAAGSGFLGDYDYQIFWTEIYTNF